MAYMSFTPQVSHSKAWCVWPNMCTLLDNNQAYLPGVKAPLAHYHTHVASNRFDWNPLTTYCFYPSPHLYLPTCHVHAHCPRPTNVGPALTEQPSAYRHTSHAHMLSPRDKLPAHDTPRPLPTHPCTHQLCWIVLEFVINLIFQPIKIFRRVLRRKDLL